MQVSKGGRPAECAARDEDGNITQPRCLDFARCDGCKRWRKDKQREERKIAAALKRRESAPEVAPEAAAPQEAPSLRLVAPPPVPYPQIDSALIHETKSSVKLPASSAWMDSPFSWEGFGPDVVEEPSPEEAQEADRAAARAERMANPSAMAQAAAGGVVWIVKSCGAEMERLGRPWPTWDKEAVQGAVLALVHANALQSAALLLPESDPPWWSCHAVTAGALSTALGSVYFARKAGAVDDGALGVDAAGAPVVDVESGEVADIGVAIDDEGFDFGGVL